MGGYDCDQSSDSGRGKDTTLILTASKSDSVKEKDTSCLLIYSVSPLGTPISDLPWKVKDHRVSQVIIRGRGSSSAPNQSL